MNPVILADNRFLDGTPTATDTASGYDVLFLRDLKTYTSWKAASFGTKYIEVDCGENKSADTLAISKHNLGTVEAQVSVESSDNGSSWTERLAPFVPATDRSILKTFVKVAARYWRVKIVTASVAPQVAVCLVGERITFPYPPDAPFVPAREKIEADSSRSKTGQLLGTVLRFWPYSVDPAWSNLSRTWVETYFVPFWENYASRLYPFFWAWDLDSYPGDVRFVRVPEDALFDPQVSMLSRYDKLSLPMEGVRQ